MTKTENTDSAGNKTDKLTPKAETNAVQTSGKVKRELTREEREAEEMAAAVKREQERVAQRQKDNAPRVNSLRDSGRIDRKQR